MNIVNLTARNIKEQSELRRIYVIREYLIKYIIHYIPPRGCGNTLLKNKLIFEEMEIKDGTN